MCLFTIPFRLRQIMKFPTNTHTSSTQCWLLPESPDPSNSSNSLKSWPPLHKIFSSLCFWFTYFPPFHGYVCSTTPQETSKRTYFRNWIRTHVYLWPHFRFTSISDWGCENWRIVRRLRKFVQWIREWSDYMVLKRRNLHVAHFKNWAWWGRRLLKICVLWF